MAAPAAAPTPNLFGLGQYDNLASFFGDQNFDYDGFVLPPVRSPCCRRLSCCRNSGVVVFGNAAWPHSPSFYEHLRSLQ